MFKYKYISINFKSINDIYYDKKCTISVAYLYLFAFFKMCQPHEIGPLDFSILL